MKILALEFSSSQRSVAVVSSPREDELRESGLSPEMAVSEIIETSPGNTMKPLGMVEDALKQAGLEREQIEWVVIGLGPGSYTGIRIAIALAQGWQLARGVKLLGISSAEGIAVQAQADGFAGKCWVAIDAQRDEFYLAGYEMGVGGLREVEPLRLATMAEVRTCEEANGTLIGPEVARWFPRGRVVFPRAATLARLASGRPDFLAGQKLQPIYLRETKFVKAPPPRVVSP